MNKMDLLLMLIFCLRCVWAITDKEYSKTPIIFHNDNYDHCMLRGDEALFCLFTYELKPIDPTNISEIWKNIQELNSNTYTYRHDLLRHAICVQETCPNINPNGSLAEEISQCYDEKFREKQLKGTVTHLDCKNNEQQYFVDFLDIFAGMLFTGYVAFVVYASVWERSILNSSKENYEKFLLTKKGRLCSAFSIPKNWNRLRTIDEFAKDHKLRTLQGVRFYNLIIIMLAHSVMGELYGPIANTKYPETMHEKVFTLFLASGSLAVGTNFFLSSFLLTYGVYSQLEGKKLTFGNIVLIFMGRLLRLLPPLIAVLTFTVTWWRHLGSGPYWSLYIANELAYCRKNWWTNLLFVHTIVNEDEMCLAHTWYLSTDTQIFLVVLVLLWLFKKYPKFLWPVLSSLLIICSCTAFIKNYTWDFDVNLYPAPEGLYLMKFVRGNPQWYIQTINFFGSAESTILGIAIAYVYYKNMDLSFIEKHKDIISKYFVLLSYGPGLTVILLPGFLSLQVGMPHSAFWASFHMAFGRLIFSIVIGVSLLILSRGLGGITNYVVNWTPTILLGRLSYTAYLIHVQLILIRSAQTRYPRHMNDYTVACDYLSDLIITYLAALVLSLLFELPFSDLQKLLIPRGTHTTVKGKEHEEKHKIGTKNDAKKVT